MNATVSKEVHISLIQAGDTVLHGGMVRTVGRSDLKNDAFMGRTLFGDSYVLGYRPVQLLILKGRNR